MPAAPVVPVAEREPLSAEEEEKRLAEAEEVRRSSGELTTLRASEYFDDSDSPNGVFLTQPPGWLGKATTKAEDSFRKRAAAGEIA